jgi:hypothetical protein
MDRLPGGPTDQDDRGISDLISFVLTFSVLVAAVGIVSTIGFEQLEDLRSSEQRDNAERSFLLLDNNIDSIQESQATVRTSELDLRSGSMTTGFGGAGSSSLTVAVNGTGVGETLQLNTLTYELDGNVWALEGGAVIKADQDDNDVLAADPEFVCRDDTAIISVVTLQGPASGTAIKQGVVGVTARYNDSRLVYPRSRSGTDSVADSEAVTVTIDSRYEDAWGDFFDDAGSGWTELSAGGDLKYRCDGDGDDEMQVYVRSTTINVSINR